MRRGRRGRPHLLCPPCPPIGRCRGQGAETSQGADTSLGAKRSGSLKAKAARARRGRCAALKSSSGCQPRARRCHGRPAPALRAPSGTEELGHRSTRGARSKDRCRQAVLGRGSHHSAKPVSSVRLRGISTVQSHRLCVPRICFDQSYRESKQGGRHCVAHLLGSVQPIRDCRILQRSTPVLVPFLLRGQVRLPVVLHDSRAVERGSNVVSSRHTSTVSKTSRGLGQRYERPQRASPGRGSRNNPRRPSGPGPQPGSRHSSSCGGGPPTALRAKHSQSKRNPAPAGQVKSLPSSRAGLPNRQLKDTLRPKSSKDPATNSTAQTATVPSAPGSSSRTTLGQFQPQSRVTGSASGFKLPGKSQAQPGLKTNSSSQPQAPGQQHSRPSVSSLGPSQPAHRSSGSSKQSPGSSKQSPGSSKQSPSSSQQSPGSLQQSPGSSKQPSTPSNQGPSPVLSPSGTNIPMQPPQKTSSGPEELAPKASKSSNHQKGSPTQAPTSTLVPEPPASCQSETSLDSTSESITEVTCSWPHHCPWLQYLQCWRLKHLAC